MVKIAVKRELKYAFLFSVTISLLLLNAPISVRATNEESFQYFEDATADGFAYLHYDGPTDWEYMRMNYSLTSPVLVKGVSYVYKDQDEPVTHAIKHRFEGNAHFVDYNDTGIPSVTDLNGAWHTFRVPGPTYLINTDPMIHFISLQNLSKSFVIASDGHRVGHTYTMTAALPDWTLFPYEDVVTLLYEPLVVLAGNTSIPGQITNIDYIDAYNLTLKAYQTYYFTLERTSGTGNVKMRVVTFAELTDTNLTISEGISYPKTMDLTPTSSGQYVLLVEAQTSGADAANYKISYSTTPPGFILSDEVLLVIAAIIGAVAGVIITFLIMRRKMQKLEGNQGKRNPIPLEKPTETQGAPKSK